MTRGGVAGSWAGGPVLAVGPIGLVSNVWAHQLDRGAALGDLLSRAAEHGVRLVELRQGSLGSLEDPRRLPDVAGLAAVAAAHPSLAFIPAYEVPFLDDRTTADHASFAAARNLALAVAGRHPPHLRLVDLETEATAAAAGTAAVGLSRLAEAMAAVDGVLSVENARQGWGPLWAAVTAAHRQLGDRAGALQLCFDPCNLSWLADEEGGDPVRLLGALPPAAIGMIHCKQQIGGDLQPVVGPGAVDWRGLLRAIAANHGATPFVFEMASGPRVWEYLGQSLSFLQGLGIPDN